MIPGEGGKERTPLSSSGVLCRQPSCQKEGNLSLVLPWHELLPLSKAARVCAWRFMGKLFYGLGFAATLTAGTGSIFAPVVIAASVIAARSAASRRSAGNIAPPTGGISRALRGDWIIATVSAPIAAANHIAA